MVRSRVGGTTNAEVDDERRRRQAGRPAVGRQPSRSARVCGGTGTLARLACKQFAPVRVANEGDKAAKWCDRVDWTGTPDRPLRS